MERLLKLLQSNQAILLAAVMSLSTQLWHSVRAFVMLDVGGADNLWNYLFGILFSTSTSLAILIFTVRGRKDLAYFFLVVEVFINIIHYSIMRMDVGPLLVSTLFMCIIVPVTIAIYSSEIDVNEKPFVAQVIKEDDLRANVLSIDKLPSVEHPTILNKSNFISEINTMIGFDITKPSDECESISEEKKSDLRNLWRQRNGMLDHEMKSKIRSILEEEASPLFK